MEGLGQEGLQLGGTGGVVGVRGDTSRVIRDVSAGAVAACQGAAGRPAGCQPQMVTPACPRGDFFPFQTSPGRMDLHAQHLWGHIQPPSRL